MDMTEQELTAKLLRAAAEGRTQDVMGLLKQGADACFQVPMPAHQLPGNTQ